MVAGESGGRSPIVKNLQSQLGLNPETADDRDRLFRDLYSDSELDIHSKEQENNIRELAALAQSQTPETLAGLPNRGDNRQEIPIPNLLRQTLPLARKPAPPVPLTPKKQPVPPAAARGQREKLTNIPGRITVDRFEVAGSTIFSKGRLNSNCASSRLATSTPGPLNEQRSLEALQLLQFSSQFENISAELPAGSPGRLNLLLARVREAKTFHAGIFTDNSISSSIRSWWRGAEVREANLSGLGDTASWIYANIQSSNTLDFNYTLPVNSRHGNVSFHSDRSKNNLVEPALEILDIEASSRTDDSSYRQRVQTPTTEIAVGIGAGRRETDTSLLGVDFVLSPRVKARSQLLYLRLFAP
ncbi:hypothetical protein [Microcoleus sp. herbarium12]|uniref:hypothetical protein n=1 Tax=Microcoleus sp. herbarium12 TaxID=3055437 RepID=UPI002FCF81C3